MLAKKRDRGLIWKKPLVMCYASLSNGPCFPKQEKRGELGVGFFFLILILTRAATFYN